MFTFTGIPNQGRQATISNVKGLKRGITSLWPHVLIFISLAGFTYLFLIRSR
jgi:hypothetical protein